MKAAGFAGGVVIRDIVDTVDNVKSVDNVNSVHSVNYVNEACGVDIEDIVDTGTTISELSKILKKLEVKSIRTATLIYKPDSYHGKIPIDFIGFSIPNRFVIGYGLDYDEFGRNLPHIYKLKH